MHFSCLQKNLALALYMYIILPVTHFTTDNKKYSYIFKKIFGEGSNTIFVGNEKWRAVAYEQLKIQSTLLITTLDTTTKSLYR